MGRNNLLRAAKVELKEIQALRKLFLQETNCQIRYDACHQRGSTDSYLLVIGDATIGYSSIKEGERGRRDTIFEFYVAPPFRRLQGALFRELIAASSAKYIECQTNDALLSPMLYEFTRSISANVVLFEDHAVTEHVMVDAVVRQRRDSDQVFKHSVEPTGDYVVQRRGEVVATGGFMLHYNMPFADLYMEVRKDCRRRGYGSFLLQEIKKECYRAGRVPAARCDIENVASRATLIKAGFCVCGFMLTGRIKNGIVAHTRA